MRDDSAEVLFKSLLREATVSSSAVGREVHSLTLSSNISDRDVFQLSNVP